MKKLIIGIITACALFLCTAPANAGIVKHTVAAVKKIGGYAGKACDAVSNVIWRNKGAVAVGATAVAVATKPEVFVGGATTIVASAAQSAFGTYAGTILFWLVAAVLVFVGVRYLARRIKVWRVLPLMIVALLLCCGVAHAGAIDLTPTSNMAVSIVKPLWDFVMVVIIAISLLL